MPRKTKDAKEIENDVKKKVVKPDVVVKKSTKIKKTSTSKKATTSNNAEAKTTSKKSNSKNGSKKNVSTRKSSYNKNTNLKTSKKQTISTKNNPKKLDNLEYYDLPYKYNQTIVKVLAQTPTTLFIYWYISDEDIEKYKSEFGDNFFETTRPILKVINNTMNYSFEVEINDFANSWYLHINDAKCDYKIELGRRPIYNPADIGGLEYIYISTSNKIEAPNNRILIDKIQNMVYFRNVKTNQTIGKSFANLSFLRNMGKIYNIYDLYKELYKDEDLEDIYNPSSRFF